MVGHHLTNWLPDHYSIFDEGEDTTTISAHFSFVIVPAKIPRITNGNISP